MFQYIAIACLLGVAAAAPSATPTAAAYVAAVDSVSVPHYGFNYAVNDPHTGDNKAQTESRDGDVVKGSYSLTEPDGTIRVVDYTADSVTGFNANVKRLGPAAHPQTLITKQAIVAPVVTQAVAPVAHVPTSLISVGIGHGHGGHHYGGLGHIGHGHGGHDYAGLGHIGHYGIGHVGHADLAHIGHGHIGHLGLGHVDLGYAGIGHHAHVGLDHIGHIGLGHGGLDHIGHIGLSHGGLDHISHIGLSHAGLDHIGHGLSLKH